jgi:hypothetical protein
MLSATLGFPTVVTNLILVRAVTKSHILIYEMKLCLIYTLPVKPR